MIKIILVFFFVISSVISNSEAQSPDIVQATSYYKTTAGAIGPNGIVTTTTYALKLASKKTIILENAVIAGLFIDGDGIIIPTNKEGTISFRIIVYTHQKDSVWYNGEIEFEGIKVPAVVQKSSISHQDDKNPAVMLYLRSSKTNYAVIKNEFDREERQYNK